MKRKLISLLLCMTMAASMLAGCGSSKETASAESETKQEETETEETEEAVTPAEDEEVTITLGIWPEDTLTDDIAVHEGYVETMKSLHPNVTCVPAYYKYSTDGFGGLRADGELLALSPGIPDGWSRYQFRIVYQNEILTVEVDRENVRLKTIGNNRIELMLYGKKVMIDGTERAFATSK